MKRRRRKGCKIRIAKRKVVIVMVMKRRIIMVKPHPYRHGEGRSEGH